MDIDAVVRQALDGDTSGFAGLSPEEVALVAERLRDDAVVNLRIDPNISLRRADTIIHLGDTRAVVGVLALGTMLRGDVLRHLHQNDEAWQLLNRAGELYQQVNDEVGWARTRVGRLAICVEMNEMEAGLRDAEAARAIFLKHQDLEKLIRLETNATLVLIYVTKYAEAIAKCQEVLRLDASLPESDPNTRIIIYINMGSAQTGTGNLQAALSCYEQARELMVARNEKLGIALADLFIINVVQAQGQNKKALRLMHDTIEVLGKFQGIETIREAGHLIECYLSLNRFSDARDLARKMVNHHPPDHENYDLATALLQLAVSEAALDNFAEAFASLERAEKVFQRLKAAGWLGTIHLYRGQIAFQQRNLAEARTAARLAAEQFRQDKQQISYLMALLLAIRVEIADGQVETALQEAHAVQNMAREFQIPHLRYEAYLLLGRVTELAGKPQRAIRFYQIATGILERLQRSLVLTSRVEFLADKQEAVQAQVRLNLALGRSEAAFAALERAKAHVWLGYLSQLDQLRWLHDDPQTRTLIEELSRLREEHHWYYRLASDQVFREQQHATIPVVDAAAEAATREHRLRALTEQLYLHSSIEDMAATSVVPLANIRQTLNAGMLLVEYYSDGSHLWAFLLDSQGLTVYPLSEPVTSVELLLEKLQSNISRALRTVRGSPNEKMLLDYALLLGSRLYDALVKPFAERLEGCQRLIVVPYGALHYVPFHLLHDGQRYLIEGMEVMVLPASSLITRPPVRQRRRALALAWNWDGRLRYTQDEAQRVVERFGGRLYSEADARRSVLEAQPCQVLHISAHGEYRINQPDFSYIQLADGPLYTDDLFQHHLDYELVTLSACETGRSRAAAGDELVGLGRGFLFAGAGALIASLWQVDETLTLEFMDELYEQLDSGVSKAAAVRGAQLALTGKYPGLHPAFWGAFELIGNADPLTKTQE